MECPETTSLLWYYVILPQVFFPFCLFKKFLINSIFKNLFSESFCLTSELHCYYQRKLHHPHIWKILLELYMSFWMQRWIPLSLSALMSDIFSLDSRCSDTLYCWQLGNRSSCNNSKSIKWSKNSKGEGIEVNENKIEKQKKNNNTKHYDKQSGKKLEMKQIS